MNNDKTEEDLAKEIFELTTQLWYKLHPDQVTGAPGHWGPSSDPDEFWSHLFCDVVSAEHALGICAYLIKIRGTTPKGCLFIYPSSEREINEN